MSQSNVSVLMNFLMPLFIMLNGISILHLHLGFLLIITLIHVVICGIIVYFTCRNIYPTFITLEYSFI